MGQFRGLVVGKGKGSRRVGTKETGLEVVAESSGGDVRVRMSHRDGQDCVEIYVTQHSDGCTVGSDVRTLYNGPVAALLATLS